jgi:hypothetical protein
MTLMLLLTGAIRGEGAYCMPPQDFKNESKIMTHLYG